MKISKRQLRRIIREEKARLLSEQKPSEMSMHDAAEYYEKQNFEGSMLDLDDYQMLEDTVVVAIRNLIRAGYTREDVAQALQTIAMDA